MKKVFILLMATCFAMSCSEFDDSDIWNKLNDHEYRIAYLEEVCNKMNEDIVNLQTIVTALEANDYIVSVSPLQDGSGYVLIFKLGKSIIINHGKDGADGKNGIDGKDGVTPTISVMKDVDGIYYWTINGEWLLINGDKVRASAIDGKNGNNGADGKDGKDGTNGITPKFKIEDNYWYISYDNGESWEALGKATGSDGLNGADGDTMFKRVYVEDGYVCFELNDGVNTIIRVPLMKEGDLLVTLENEGTLSRILTSEETRTTTSLSIKGYINTDDMRHIQIMNNLRSLDLGNAIFVENTGYGIIDLNPYKDTLINKSIEEVVFPKESASRFDFSYCLALKKITITRDNAIFEAIDKVTNYQADIKFCPNIETLEYAEGVLCPSGNSVSRWETINSLGTIIYPSTVTKIPSNLTVYNTSEKVTVSGYKYANLYTIPCKTLICKAKTPPIKPSNSVREYFYDWDNNGYYDISSEGSYKSIDIVTVPQDAILYVPKESIDLYRSAPIWEIFQNIKAIEDME